MILCKEVTQKWTNSFLHQSKCVGTALPAITVAMRSSFWLGATNHTKTDKHKEHTGQCLCVRCTRRTMDKAEKTERHVLSEEKLQTWCQPFDISQQKEAGRHFNFLLWNWWDWISACTNALKWNCALIATFTAKMSIWICKLVETICIIKQITR